jgi:hypothetical protein
VNTLRNVFLVLLVSIVGCGQQLVEFPLSDPPTVLLTAPTDAATGVGLDTVVRAVFSKGMAPSSLTPATFTLMQNDALIPAVVGYAGLTATLTPASPLPAGAVLTATITTGATDTDGTALAATYKWSFTTRDPADTTAPTVRFTDPADGDSSVALNIQINAAFSEAMRPDSLDAASFTVKQGDMMIPGAVSYSGLSVTFVPENPLAASALVTATIGVGAEDLAGNALASPYVWSFTTSPLPDVTSPAVTFTDPADMATGVDSNVKIQVAFNETMDCKTIDATTFIVTQGLSPILGTVSCNGPTATFTPLAPLTGIPTYTATITTGAHDPAGNALLQDYVWSFETGPHAGLTPVYLGDASSYAILAFNTVTNVNNPGTLVTGDLGISPGAALVGFPPGEVVGAIHKGDAIAAAAKASLLAAYNDAAGRLNPAVLPADLSGLTFAPGLYKNSTSVMIASGNLTLDAKGDTNAVFIFQIGSTLTTNAATHVILSGGAKASNVFWAVGTSATLGTTSIFKGTILAATAITMKTGAVLEGRLLAQAAAVSLDTNVITAPAP